MNNEIALLSAPSSRVLSRDLAAVGGACAGSLFVVSAGSAVLASSSWGVASRWLQAHLVEVGCDPAAVLARVGALWGPAPGVSREVPGFGLPVSVSCVPVAVSA